MFFPNVNRFIRYKYNKDNVLEIDIHEGNEKPYYLKSKGPVPSGVYVRIGSSTRQATEYEIKYMVKESFNYSFENEISSNQNLHFVSVSRYFDLINIKFDLDKYKTLNIINNDNKYTNLGLLLSDENPIEIKFAVYKGVTSNEFKVKKELKGSIIDITKQLLDLSELYNDTSAKIIPHKMERVELKSYPGASLREAVMNAICHADYSIPSNIKIEFYDDRVEITSPGGIYGGATLDDLLEGIQTFRNPRLINILSKLNLIENYGTGIKRIIELYPIDKFNKDDLFYISNMYFKVKLKNYNYDNDNLFIIEKGQEKGQERGQEKGQENIDKCNVIICLIKNNHKITRNELSNLSGYSEKQVRNILEMLKKSGKLKRVGSTKTGYWKIE